MKIPLYPFQAAGVDEIVKRDGKALLADEVGLGKTLQAIEYASRSPRKVPALVICPGVLRVNWYREIKRWTDLTAAVFSPMSTVKRLLMTGVHVVTDPAATTSFLIASYESFVRHRGEFLKRYCELVIFDEAQALKDQDSLRSEAALAMAVVTPHVLLLSGTPALNRPKELWNLVRLAQRGAIGLNYWEFGRRYCAGFRQKIWKKGPNGPFQDEVWNFDGASNLTELAQRLRSTCMIRRTKEEVQLELPPIRRVTVPVATGGLSEFEEHLDRLQKLVEERRGLRASTKTEADAARLAEQASKTGKLKTRARKETDGEFTILGEISRARKAVGLAKVASVAEYVAVKAEGDSVLVFAHHHEVIDAIYTALAAEGISCSKIDGRTPADARQVTIDAFQKGDIRVLVLGVLAAGTGLTLTRSATVVFAELPWRPGDIEQATGRVHRISQERGVTEHVLVAAGTIEEKIAVLLDAKREVVAASTGNGLQVLSEEGILDAIMDS